MVQKKLPHFFAVFPAPVSVEVTPARTSAKRNGFLIKGACVHVEKGILHWGIRKLQAQSHRKSDSIVGQPSTLGNYFADRTHGEKGKSPLEKRGAEIIG